MITKKVRIDQYCEVSPDGIRLEKLEAGKTYDLTPHAADIVLSQQWGHLEGEEDDPSVREAKVEAPEEAPRMRMRGRRG